VADLPTLARRHGEERRRKEAERQWRARARREREAAAVREKYLAGLAQHEPEVWARVNALIATKRPGDYDQAVQLLKDLSDLGIRSGRSPETQAHNHQFQDQHVNKPSSLWRGRKARPAIEPQQTTVGRTTCISRKIIGLTYWPGGVTE